MNKPPEGKQDYYSLLHIGYDASSEEIRAAYKRLALLTHPDRSGHPLAHQQMQLLNEAFAVLGNPEKKAHYDQDRLASHAIIPVENLAQTEYPSQAGRQGRKDLEGRLLQNQLKKIAYLILAMISLFFWSLISGRVNMILIMLVVMLAVFTLASIIVKVRNLDS